MFKRSVDITLAGVLLTISLPFIALAAILIKLDSDGPVLYRQVRVGRRFKRFHILKLRTMKHFSVGPAYTVRGDPRVTRVGCWLRRSKLDELPQFWHVLRGEMSLVGPRPVVPELTEEFRQDYERLLEMRPGLTDPAALKYRQEADVLAVVPDPLKYFMTVEMPDKLRLSQDYMQRATVLSDLAIMLRTLVALMQFVVPAKTSTRVPETRQAISSS